MMDKYCKINVQIALLLFNMLKFYIIIHIYIKKRNVSPIIFFIKKSIYLYIFAKIHAHKKYIFLLIYYTHSNYCYFVYQKS